VSTILRLLTDSPRIAFTIEGRGFDVTRKIRAQTQRTVSTSLRRFIRHIRRIEVLLEDVNGPRGGVDKRCRIDLYLKQGGRLTSLANSLHAAAAVTIAARRARVLLHRRCQKARSGRFAIHEQSL
jgi:hypothetical protein